MKAIREASPQARHHFTQADQVNQLISASEAEPERGFMAADDGAVLIASHQPRQPAPVHARQWSVQTHHEYDGEHKLPFGHLPRLLMAWISTEAVRTQSRVLVLGDSLSEFMRALDIYSSDGKAYIRLRNQMDRLFNANVRLIYEDEHGKAVSFSSAIADRGEFWWDPKRPNERVLWDSKIRLGEDFFNEIINHPVPLDMNTLTALKRSPLGLDLYMWAVYRTFSLKRLLRLTWPTLYRQLGVDPSRASDNVTVQRFRKDCLRELKKIKLAWPELNYRTAKGVLILLPSKPSIAPADPSLRLTE